mgnify:CR=1 FL=1
MSVALDVVSESHTGTAGATASFSWTHTPTGTPRGVLIYVFDLGSSTDTVLSVSYGGVSVPAVSGGRAVDSVTEPGSCKTYFLGSGVPTGAATVSVNLDTGAAEHWAVCVTVGATGNTEVYTPGIVLLEGDGTLAEQSVDDGSPGTSSLRFAGGFSGLAAFPPTGANSTAVHNFDTGQQTAAVVGETTGGQGARLVGFTSGTSDDRAFVHLAVREVASGTPVNADRQLLWSARAAVGVSRQPIWNVRKAINSSRQLLWGVRTFIDASRTLSWGVRTFIGASRALSWNARAAIVASRALSWDTRVAVGGSRVLSWSARTFIGASRALLWGVRTKVTASRVLLWGVRLAAGATRVLVWAARAPIYAVRTAYWNIEKLAAAPPSVDDQVGRTRRRRADLDQSGKG